MAMKWCSQENAAHELERIRKRYGDGCANCTAIRFRDSIGRLSRNETPVADAQNIVKIILLLPGEQAAREAHSPSSRPPNTQELEQSG